MSEVFVERIIKRKISFKGMMLRLLSIILVLLGVFSIFILGLLGMTITAVLIYVSYLCWAYTNIEYEYSFLNGELTIDKIMGERKRRHVAEFNIKEAEIVAPSLSDDIVRASHNAVIKDFSSGHDTKNMYSMIIAGKDGRSQVVFEPDENMIEAMYHVRPNIVKKPQ